MIVFHHYGNATFKKEPVKFNNVIVVNSKKFKQKWGFDASLTETIKSKTIGVIIEPRDKEMNILEIGCSRATTLLKLKYLYPNSQLFGVETNKKIAAITNNLITNSTKDRRFSS